MEALFEDLPEEAKVGEELNEGRKRRMVADQKGSRLGNEQEILTATVKLALATALRARILASLCYMCFKVPLADPVIAAMKAATVKFSETQKSLKEKMMSPDDIREKIGIPCIHAFTAMAVAVASASSLKEQLMKSVAGWSKMAGSRKLWVFMNDYIEICRLEKMWDMSTKKFVIKIEGTIRTEPSVEDLNPAEYWALYIRPKLLANPAVKELQGVVPPGELERVLQAHLDKGKD